MKRLTISLLMAVLLTLPCHQSKSQIPIAAKVILQCVVASGIGAGALMIFKCEPDYYLVRYQMDGEDPHWACSQASASCLAKTGGRRCEGPFKKRDEPDLRAWANNKTPDNPMYPCGPLGTIPNATWTNYTLVSVQVSTNDRRKLRGNRWSYNASVVVEPGESNWMICLLGPAGTNGMSESELQWVSEADVVIEHALPAASEANDYGARAAVTEIPNGLVADNPGKSGQESK